MSLPPSERWGKKVRPILRRMVQSSDSIGIYEEGCFICPLCRCTIRPFDFDPDHISLEHVPTRALGGKGIILTCKKCNNFSGTEFESDLSKRTKSFEKMRIIAGADDGEVTNVKFRLFGTELSANLMRQGQRVHLDVDPLHNDPTKLEQFINLGKEISGCENVNLPGSISFEGFKRDRAKWGDFKSALLALFSVFGYRLVASKIYDPLAERFKNQRFDNTCPSMYLYTPARVPDILVDESNGAAMVKFGDANVVIPWPSKSLENFEQIRSQENLKLEGKSFVFPTKFMGK